MTESRRTMSAGYSVLISVGPVPFHRLAIELTQQQKLGALRLRSLEISQETCQSLLCMSESNLIFALCSACATCVPSAGASLHTRFRPV